MEKTENKVLSEVPNQKKQLRLLPGIIIVLLQWIGRFVIPMIAPGDLATLIGVFVGILGGLAVVIWWAFFSRAQKSERWGAILLMIVALLLSSQFIHESIGLSMQGLMFTIYSFPVLSLAFIIWAVVSRNFSDKLRRVTMVATILLASGFWTMLRTEGMSGDIHHDFKWRWSQTYEEKFLNQSGLEKMASLPVLSDIETNAEWPGFRGPNRDGIIHGVQIKTDWNVSAPVEMWRRPIGSGCSSFAVHGKLLYTQEQRGDEELVSCYNLITGELIWKHQDAARFWDSHAGAGPRSTPTLKNNLVYTLGATGILNVLDAYDGSVIWTRNAAADVEVKLPGWGFASSPLVVDDLVIVAFAGALVAYDITTGEPRWFGPDGGGDSYSSPHLFTIDGVQQVLLMSGAGASSFLPSDGTMLWENSWSSQGRIIQPSQTTNGELLISAGGINGIGRIAVTNGPNGWKSEEIWTSTGLKTNFYDIVIHEDYAYGFVGPFLACMDVKDGIRMWKKGHYAGFSILLADQDLLLVLTEKGEVVLVKATPDQFTELARLQAIEGKTWNHPVLVNDVLVVRNAREMVAYRLSLLSN